MRPFNVSLNQTKLELEKQRLAKIETQLVEAVAYVKAIEERKQAKLNQVFQLETSIQTALNSQAVSE